MGLNKKGSWVSQVKGWGRGRDSERSGDLNPNVPPKKRGTQSQGSKKDQKARLIKKLCMIRVGKFGCKDILINENDFERRFRGLTLLPNLFPRPFSFEKSLCSQLVLVTSIMEYYSGRRAEGTEAKSQKFLYPIGLETLKKNSCSHWIDSYYNKKQPRVKLCCVFQMPAV